MTYHLPNTHHNASDLVNEKNMSEDRKRVMHIAHTTYRYPILR